MAKYKTDELEALMFKLRELKAMEERCIQLSFDISNIIESVDRISSERFGAVRSVLNQDIAYIEQLIFAVSSNMNEEVYGPPRSQEVIKFE